MENSIEISTEDEKEIEVGYFLRSKRKLLNNDTDLSKDPKRRKIDKSTTSITKKKNLLKICLLPNEILRYIFKLFSYKELSTSIRLVCNKFRLISEDILNSDFNNLNRKFSNLLNYTITAVQTAEGEMEIKLYCRLLSMLETVEFQHDVIMATIWRYVYNDRYETPKCSMYAGLLLDKFKEFLFKFINSPIQLCCTIIGRDYGMSNEVKEIVNLSKSFCLHFERINEEQLNENLLISGCKILDLMDCARYVCKDVVNQTVEDNIFKAQYRYFFSNSWFMVLNIKTEKQMNWMQRQRMMHMRIRRIILAHTEMLMQHNHYKREVTIRRNENLPLIRRPSNNVYTGYGDIQDRFFFYGVMNDGAYLQKFYPNYPDGDEEENNDIIINDIFEDIEDQIILDNEVWPILIDLNEEISTISIEDNNENVEPYLGLHIDVKVKCPLSHAPKQYLKINYPSPLNNLNEITKRNNEKKCKFFFDLTFHCTGAKFPRLPTTFSYEYHLNP